MNRNNRVLQNKCLELNFRETDQLFITLASPQTSFGVSFVALLAVLYFSLCHIFPPV